MALVMRPIVPGGVMVKLKMAVVELATEAGGMLEPTGTVEFRAHFLRGGVAGVQHEVSRFVREDGRWVYLDAL